jgi:hypothetical protein
MPLDASRRPGDQTGRPREKGGASTQSNSGEGPPGLPRGPPPGPTGRGALLSDGVLGVLDGVLAPLDQRPDRAGRPHFQGDRLLPLLARRFPSPARPLLPGLPSLAQPRPAPRRVGGADSGRGLLRQARAATAPRPGHPLRRRPPLVPVRLTPCAGDEPSARRSLFHIQAVSACGTRALLSRHYR